MAAELETAEIVLLPDESRLSPDGAVVQPDGIVVTPHCRVLIEAKGMGGRSSFQPEQLPREYMALIRGTDDKVPLLFLVLGEPPPVAVKGHGRLDLAEAMAVHIEKVRAETEGVDATADELLQRLPQAMAWTTWHDIKDVVVRQAADLGHLEAGVAGTIRRLSEAVSIAVDWHSR